MNYLSQIQTPTLVSRKILFTIFLVMFCISTERVFCTESYLIDHIITDRHTPFSPKQQIRIDCVELDVCSIGLSDQKRIRLHIDYHIDEESFAILNSLFFKLSYDKREDKDTATKAWSQNKACLCFSIIRDIFIKNIEQNFDFDTSGKLIPISQKHQFFQRWVSDTAEKFTTSPHGLGADKIGKITPRDFFNPTSPVSQIELF